MYMHNLIFAMHHKVIDLLTDTVALLICFVLNA